MADLRTQSIWQPWRTPQQMQSVLDQAQEWLTSKQAFPKFNLVQLRLEPSSLQIWFHSNKLSLNNQNQTFSIDITSELNSFACQAIDNV